MRILLVHPEINIKYGAYGYQSGLAALSASLKAAGYEDVHLLHLSGRYRPVLLQQAVERLRPDLVGFYTTHQQFRYVQQLLTLLPPGVFRLLGGPHPTTVPDCLQPMACLDAICLGEGDHTIVELARALAEKRDCQNISGLAWKNGATTVVNPTSPFIEDLDTLPDEDRDLFASVGTAYSGLLNISYRNSFRIGRGCPYRCSFCSNAMQAAAQMGKFVRYRSLDRILSEIETVVRTYRPETLFFQDDTFMTNLPLLNEFCDRYASRFRLPFEFLGRVDQVTEDLVARLHRAGARRVSFGIESGDEPLRREVLRKPITNEQIIRAFAICRRHGLQVEAYLIIGFPGETPAAFRRTIKLMKQVRPDLYTLAVYLPTPGTELYEMCRTQNLLRYQNLPLHAIPRREVLLVLPNFSARAIRRFLLTFPFHVYGRTSPFKAFLFSLYETGWGDRLLALLGPWRQSLRRLVLRLGF